MEGERATNMGDIHNEVSLVRYFSFFINNKVYIHTKGLCRSNIQMSLHLGQRNHKVKTKKLYGSERVFGFHDLTSFFVVGGNLKL